MGESSVHSDRGGMLETVFVGHFTLVAIGPKLHNNKRKNGVGPFSRVPRAPFHTPVNGLQRPIEHLYVKNSKWS